MLPRPLFLVTEYSGTNNNQLLSVSWTSPVQTIWRIRLHRIRNKVTDAERWPLKTKCQELFSFLYYLRDSRGICCWILPSSDLLDVRWMESQSQMFDEQQLSWIVRNAWNGLDKVQMFNEWHHFPVEKNGRNEKAKNVLLKKRVVPFTVRSLRKTHSTFFFYFSLHSFRWGAGSVGREKRFHILRPLSIQLTKELVKKLK